MAQDTEHPPPALELTWELPPGWSQTRSSAQAAVTAQAPDAAAAPSRPPRVTATLETARGSLRAWWDGLESVLPQALEDYQLLDRGDARVAGLPGVRRLVHYSGRDGAPTLLEQWAAQDGELRIVVMATVPPRRYDHVTDTLVAMVAGARVRPREATAR